MDPGLVPILFGPNTASAYLGVVATRGIVGADGVASSFPEGQTETYHRLRDSFSAFRMLFVDFYCNGGAGFVETGSGAPTTVSSSLEIAGTRYRATFSGSNDGTYASGALLVSDLIQCSGAVRGNQVCVRQYKRNANGMVYNQNGGSGNKSAALGDVVFIGSGLSDFTMSGAPAGNNSNAVLTLPIILAYTTRTSVLITGDSKATGTSGTGGGNASGDAGEFAQIGANYAYINAAIAGDSALSAGASHAIRAALAPYTTHVISNYGINDVRGGASAATTETRLQSVWAAFAGSGRKIYQSTITPATILASPEATNGVRTTVNDWLRTVPTGLNGVIEMADVIEDGRNTGLIKAGYSDDHIHPNQTGYDAEQAANLLAGLSR